MLSVREAAALLGVSTGLVYALVSRGRLRHERFGLGRGVIRISKEAIEEYRKSCEFGPREVPTRIGSPTRLKHLRL